MTLSKIGCVRQTLQCLWKHRQGHGAVHALRLFAIDCVDDLLRPGVRLVEHMSLAVEHP